MFPKHNMNTKETQQDHHQARTLTFHHVLSPYFSSSKLIIFLMVLFLNTATSSKSINPKETHYNNLSGSKLLKEILSAKPSLSSSCIKIYSTNNKKRKHSITSSAPPSDHGPPPLAGAAWPAAIPGQRLFPLSYPTLLLPPSLSFFKLKLIIRIQVPKQKIEQPLSSALGSSAGRRPAPPGRRQHPLSHFSLPSFLLSFLLLNQKAPQPPNICPPPAPLGCAWLATAALMPSPTIGGLPTQLPGRPESTAATAGHPNDLPRERGGP